MLLAFPTPEILTRILSAGELPSGLVERSVAYCRGPDSWITLDTARRPSGRGLRILTDGGATFPAQRPEGRWDRAACWAEVVPPTAAPGVPRGATVWRFHSAASAARLARRLRVASSPGFAFALIDGKPRQFLIRGQVSDARSAAVTAEFVEHAYRVLPSQAALRIGFAHPLESMLLSPDGRIRLIDADGVTVLPTPRWQSIDGAVPMVVSAVTHVTQSSDSPPPRIVVRPSLRPAKSMPPVTHWMVDSPAVETIRSWLQSADENAVNELDFLACESADRVFLRVRIRRSGTQLPDGFLPFGNRLIPSVAVPVGQELRPLMDRTALRRIVASEECLSFLRPAIGGVVAESIREEFLEPLRDHVEYVVPQVADSVVASRRPWDWIEFAIRVDPTVIPTRAVERNPPAVMPVLERQVITAVRGSAPPRTVEAASSEPAFLHSGSQAVQALIVAQQQFQADPSPWGDPSRTEAWEQLGRLSAACDETSDAVVCLGFSRWNADPSTTFPSWLEVKAESAASAAFDASAARTADPSMRSMAAIRSAAIRVLSVADVPGTIPSVELQQLVAILDAGDDRLPVRIAWLVWKRLSRLSGGDYLQLTRAADRLCADLFEMGLRRERDIPSFVRNSAESTIDRPLSAGAKASAVVDLATILKLWDQVRTWCLDGWTRGSSKAVLALMVDSTFAIGLCRFGERSAAERVEQESRRTVERMRRSHDTPDYQRWLIDAYRNRFEATADGRPVASPLSDSVRESVTRLSREGRIAAERIVRASSVLDPTDRIDPFRGMRYESDSLSRGLAELAADRRDSQSRRSSSRWERLREQYGILLKRFDSPYDRMRILSDAIPASVRLGESSAVEYLKLVPDVLKSLGRHRGAADLVLRTELTESAVSVAAYFDRSTLVEPIVDGLRSLLSTIRGEVAAWLIAGLSGTSHRLLMRMGKEDSAVQIARDMTTSLLGDATPRQMADRPAFNAGVMIPAMLKLSGPWFRFGPANFGAEALEIARRRLADPAVSPEPRNQLATTYAVALGQSSVDIAVTGYQELLQSLTVSTLTIETETIQRMRIVEAIVLGLADDEFASDDGVRRRMDEEEQLIRRRIREDLKAHQ